MTKQKARAIIYFLIALSGLMALSYGLLKTETNKEDIYLYMVMASGGASFFGIGAGLLISTMLGTEIDDLKEYFFNEEHISSKHEDAKYCSGEWNLYHVSLKKDERVWMHGVTNFRIGKEPGSLQGEIYWSDKKNNKKKYILNVGIRSRKLIILGYQENETEQHLVMAIENATAPNIDIKCGIQLHETWDGFPDISPVLMSRYPITDEKLDNVWQSEAEIQKITISFSYN
ncbi:MAG: hypothetical protein KDF49_01310 [Nitrosomonas sp.]|nr:hypothetical protein [Calditrichota bacterium]MCB1984049.1 hypothetical protein [Nitrosomonas sp.]